MIDKFPAHATVSHHFSGPAERVFDAWLDTEVIGKFMFGPEVRDEQIISLNADVGLVEHSHLLFAEKVSMWITLASIWRSNDRNTWCLPGQCARICQQVPAL